MLPPTNINPTVDQILAQQRGPGLAPVPAPTTARAAPGKANLGLLAVLGRALARATSPPPPPSAAPPATAPVQPQPALAQPAVGQPVAQSLPMASPRTMAIHRSNLRQVYDILGGLPFTPEQISEVNRAVRQLALGHEASPEEAEQIAADLAADFGWTPSRSS
jgi:hypothetical protein